VKELLRLLVKEIRVHNRRRIVPVYPVPALRAIPRKVELWNSNRRAPASVHALSELSYSPPRARKPSSTET